MCSVDTVLPLCVCRALPLATLWKETRVYTFVHVEGFIPLVRYFLSNIYCTVSVCSWYKCLLVISTVIAVLAAIFWLAVLSYSISNGKQCIQLRIEAN